VPVFAVALLYRFRCEHTSRADWRAPPAGCSASRSRRQSPGRYGGLLEIAMLCVRRLERAATVLGGAKGDVQPERGRIGGNAFATLMEVIHRHLLGAGWVSVLSFGATIGYFEQANIVAGRDP
jgi:hypothetical protein